MIRLRTLPITGLSLLFVAFGIQAPAVSAQQSTDVVLQTGYQTSATPAQGEMNRFHAILQNNTGTQQTVDVALELRNAQGNSLAHVRYDGVAIDPYNIAVRTLDSPANLSPGTYTWQTRIFHPGTQNLIVGYENALQFTVRGDGITPPPPPEGEHRCGRPGTNNFNACYYDNIDFTAFRVNRTDPAIDFDWGQGSPDPSIAPDTFSARWWGLFEFEEGMYEFTVTTDDGFRLNVDNEWILDEFHDQPATTYTVRKHMPTGQRGVIAEYYENTGDAVAMLSWRKVEDGDIGEGDEANCERVPNDRFNGCYYDSMDFTNFRVQRVDEMINFDWGQGSPHPSIGSDTFSARWHGSFAFDADEYEFSVTTDDGFRLYVNDELVIDAWHDQPATTHTARRTMSQGRSTIRAEYYENHGDAVAMLEWSKIDD